MQNIEFEKLLRIHANKTSNIRSLNSPWASSGAHRVPDSIATQIGKIVTLLQANIDKGLLCKKQEQHLLIYNFQPIIMVGTTYLYAIDIVIKPNSEITMTHEAKGIPLQLVVKENGDIINNSQALIEIGITSEAELKKGGEEQPHNYGNYNDFPILHNNCSTLNSSKRSSSLGSLLSAIQASLSATSSPSLSTAPSPSPAPLVHSAEAKEITTNNTLYDFLGYLPGKNILKSLWGTSTSIPNMPSMPSMPKSAV